MAEVFISYTKSDEIIARRVQATLLKDNITSWIGCDDIPGGTNYTKEIMKAICDCRVFVLILSKKTMESQYVLMELDQAVKRRKNIIPFVLEELTLTDEFDFLISSHQGIVAFQDLSNACQKLTSRIREIMNECSSHTKTAETITGTAFFRASKGKRGTKIIRCPYCKSRKLRDSISIYEYTLDNPDVGAIITLGGIFLFALITYPVINPFTDQLLAPMQNRIMEEVYQYISNVYGSEFVAKFFVLLIIVFISVIAISMFIAFIKIMIVAYTGLYNQTVSEKVKRRRFAKGISFWTFRCVKCNHKFRKKILIKEQANYSIEAYPEATEKEIVAIFLELLKAISNKIWKPYNFNKRKEI